MKPKLAALLAAVALAAVAAPAGARVAARPLASAAAMRSAPRALSARGLASGDAMRSSPRALSARGLASGDAMRSSPRALSARGLAFHDAMRKLWEDHITWTRLAIVSFAAGLPDLPATEARLLANQRDIGDAIKPYSGRAAGNRLTTLLKDHILGAVAVLQAAKAGDQGATAKAVAAWYANGAAIAGFLHAANPHRWSRAAMRSMMKAHLDETLKEAEDRLAGRFDADVRDYEAVHRHILAMADMLSSGIMRQFPGRFR